MSYGQCGRQSCHHQAVLKVGRACGGGGSKAVTLWESDGVHISPGSVEASNEYRWIVIWLGASLDTTSPIAVAWGTNNVYAIPQMDRSVRGAIIAYSGTRLTISTQMGVVASKVQVANWE